MTYYGAATLITERDHAVQINVNTKITFCDFSYVNTKITFCDFSYSKQRKGKKNETYVSVP